VLALVAALTTVVTAYHCFPRGTSDLDEVALQAQGNALAVGRFTLPTATHEPFFRPFLSGLQGQNVVFKYQPLWPALIAASDALFGSSMPVRVLFSVAGMLAVAWLAWELVRDQRVALLAAALMVCSPFMWVETASILGYHLSLVLGTAASAALIRAVRVRTIGAGVLAGALLGLAIMHRPFDAVLAAAPVIAYVSWQAWRTGVVRRLAAGIGAGTFPFVALFLAYDQVTTGSPLRMAFRATGRIDDFGFGWRASFDVPNSARGGQVHYTVGLALATVRHTFAVLPRFIGFAPLVAACVGVLIWKRRKDERVWLLVAMIGTVIVGYFFWWGTANAYNFGLEYGLGPFYHYPMLGPLFVAASWGFMSLRSRNAKIVLALVGFAWTGGAGVVVLRDAQVAGAARAAELAALDAPGRSLVLEVPLFPHDPYVRYANDGNLRGKELVAVDIPGRRLEVIDRFPDHKPFLLRSFRRFDDPFGEIHRDRIPLEVIRSPSVELAMHANVKGNLGATAYLRIGQNDPHFFMSGTGAVDGSFGLTARSSGLLRGGSTEVAVGVAIAQPGTPAPRSLTGDWYECRFEARAVPDGRISALAPCEGWHHYVFPGGKSATVLEDLTGRLDVHVSPR
jgi:hypothetical protein